MSANGVLGSGKKAAALGLHKFGFGPVGDAITAIAADPRGALLADLERPGAGRLDTPNLISSAEAAREVFDFRAERRAQQKLALRPQKEVATERRKSGLRQWLRPCKRPARTRHL